jgi:methionine-S-sulfoxide reductase
MHNLRQALVVAAVLAAVWTVGATVNKPAPTNPAHYETATLAGGCFWGLQETLRQIPGVIKTTAGYTGGTMPNPTYELVAGGKSGHVEAVEVVFDPARLSYETLLADFLAARNPGLQNTNNVHRSTIFYHDDGQRQTAERVKDQINQSGKWLVPVPAEIRPAKIFYPAEEYHQDYYRKTAAIHACELEKN